MQVSIHFRRGCPWPLTNYLSKETFEPCEKVSVLLMINFLLLNSLPVCLLILSFFELSDHKLEVLAF